MTDYASKRWLGTPRWLRCFERSLALLRLTIAARKAHHARPRRDPLECGIRFRTDDGLVFVEPVPNMFPGTTVTESAPVCATPTQSPAEGFMRG